MIFEGDGDTTDHQCGLHSKKNQDHCVLGAGSSYRLYGNWDVVTCKGDGDGPVRNPESRGQFAHTTVCGKLEIHGTVNVLDCSDEGLDSAGTRMACQMMQVFGTVDDLRCAGGPVCGELEVSNSYTISRMFDQESMPGLRHRQQDGLPPHRMAQYRDCDQPLELGCRHGCLRGPIQRTVRSYFDHFNRNHRCLDVPQGAHGGIQCIAAESHLSDVPVLQTLIEGPKYHPGSLQVCAGLGDSQGLRVKEVMSNVALCTLLPAAGHT